jgi:broad specificity phosphatase PhoE
LAQVLNPDQHPEPVFDPRLREKGGGIYEGSPLGTSDKEAKKRGIAIREFRPEGGESWMDVNIRARLFLRELLDRYLVSSRPVRILMVSHGGCIMELNNVILALKGKSAIQANVAKNTSLTIIRVTQKAGKPTFTEVLSNDISHLT